MNRYYFRFWRYVKVLADQTGDLPLFYNSVRWRIPRMRALWQQLPHRWMNYLLWFKR